MVDMEVPLMYYQNILAIILNCISTPYISFQKFFAKHVVTFLSLIRTTTYPSRLLFLQHYELGPLT